MRAFWPLYSIVLATAGLYFLGLVEPLSIEALWIISLTIGLSVIWAMYRGLRTLALPTLFDAERIVDQALRNHPISVLRETGFVGTNHHGADALWAAHMDQMQQEAQQARHNLLIFAYRAWIRLVCAISCCCLPPWVFCLDLCHVWLI